MRLLFLMAVALLFVGVGAKAQSGCAWTLYQDGYYRSNCGGYWYLASGNQVYIWTTAGWQLTGSFPGASTPSYGGSYADEGSLPQRYNNYDPSYNPGPSSDSGYGSDDGRLPERYNNYDPRYNPRPADGDHLTNLNPLPLNG